MSTFCTECGAQNQDQDYYCITCGAKLIKEISAKQSFLDQDYLPISQPASSYRREAYQIQTDVTTSQFNLIKLAFGVYGVLGLILLLDFFLRFFSAIYLSEGALMGLMVSIVPFVGVYLFLAISLFNYRSNIEVNSSLSKEGRTIGQILFLVTVMIIIDGFLELFYILDLLTLDYFFSIRIPIFFLMDSLILIAFYKFSNWLSTVLTLSDIRSFQPKLLVLFSVLMLVYDSFIILDYYLQIILDPILFDGVYLIVQFLRTIAGFSIYSILGQIQR
jgi:hypothetical protein